MTTSVKPLKWYKSLAEKQGRISAGAFLIEGERAVRQVAERQPDCILEILYTDVLPSWHGEHAVRQLTPSQMRSISSATTPQGIAAVVRLPADLYSDRLPVCTGSRLLFLEDIQDPGNIGTLIRTGAAFDFSGVIMTDKCADPFSPKCVQSTAGSVLSLWIRRSNQYLSIMHELKKRGYRLVATDLKGDEDMSVLHGNADVILALGNEASGLSREILQLADYRLRIPTTSEVNSLNVASCGSICMFLIRQHAC